MRSILVLLAVCSMAHADDPPKPASNDHPTSAPPAVHAKPILPLAAQLHDKLHPPIALAHLTMTRPTYDRSALDALARLTFASVHGSPVHVVPVTNTDATAPGHTGGLGVRGRF